MKKRFLAFFLTLAMTLTLLPTVVSATPPDFEGYVGDHIYWYINQAFIENGRIHYELCINCDSESDGKIPDYDNPFLPGAANRPPWEEFIDPDSYYVLHINTRFGVTASGLTCDGLITDIGSWAFANSDNINIDIGDINPSEEYMVKNIGEGAFAGCNLDPSWDADGNANTTTFFLSKGVKTIGAYAFANCDGLTEAGLPDGLTHIGKNAFENTDLGRIYIPSSVISIGEDAFASCADLSGGITYGGPGDLGDSDYGRLSVWDTMAQQAGIADNMLSSETWLIYDQEIAAAPETSLQAGAPGETVVITSNASFKGTPDVTDIVVSQNGTNLRVASAELRNGRKLALVLADSIPYAGQITVTVPCTAFRWFNPDQFEPDDDYSGHNITSVSTSANVAEAAPVLPPALDPDPEPAPSRPSSSDRDDRDDRRQNTVPAAPQKPTVVRVDGDIQTGERETIVISGQGESDMQYIVREDPHTSWIDRVELPRYARNLYDVLCIGGDHDQLFDILIDGRYNTVSGGKSGGGTANVESVLELVSKLDAPLASGNGAFQEGSFLGGFDVIDTTAGDRAVQYADLKEGDVVRTSAYNAIYVTKVPKSGNPGFDADLKAACTYASTAFQAFDRDHPEVFWLSGSSKLRMVTVTMKDGNRTYKETYIFFVLADAEGFTVRDSSYPNQAEIESGIQRRDRAVEAILSTVSGTTVYEKVAQLNRWLTEHNHYNTSPDLLNLPNAPHECLSALEGNIGTSGPVCDGYSRAFKVLCDRLEIPCVLVDGYALTRAGGPGEFHMWNSVRMPDEQWYGVDVTWNDPTVKGVEDAKSGREREDFLLVGGETVVLGLKFSESHPPKNRAANGGVAFINGPTLSAAAFNPLAGAEALPFEDVGVDSWYYSAVEYVFSNGWMKGTSGREFSPDRPVTRAMVWTVLARLAGEDQEGGTPWYAGTQSWAVRTGLSDGTNPDALVTRQQLVTMLWRYAGSPASGGSLESFRDSGAVSGYAADAVCWAVEKGIVTGQADGTFRPEGTATRAHTAAILERFCGNT